MKKSLLAVAVLASFAGVASAQTNVTVYGIVDMGLQRTDTSVAGVDPKWALDSGLQSGSRLGFKGTEDLGGGLSASFQLENGFTADNGMQAQGGRLFGRQSWVGLNGGFGSVKLGRQNTPMYVATSAIDPFEIGLAGDLQNTVNTFGQRMDNTVNYSLTAGAFSGQIAYGFGEVAGNTTANRQLGLSFGYANGPVNAILAYHKQQNATGTASGKTLFLGGTYDFGVVKAHASFADNKGDAAFGAIGLGFIPSPTAAQTAAFNALALDDTLRTRDYMLGVSAPIGANSVMASFQHKKDRDSDAKFNLFAVGYVYNLSKRTNLYTSLGFGKLTDSGVDEKNNKFNVGIRHKF
jgi:predicted porin